MTKITPKEYAIFCFIRQFLIDHNQSPTRKEIALSFAITPQGADYFVRQLVNKEVIQLRQKGVRNIRVLKKYLGRQKHLW